MSRGVHIFLQTFASRKRPASSLSLYTCSCIKQMPRVLCAHAKANFSFLMAEVSFLFNPFLILLFLRKALKRIFLFLICLPLTTFKINKKRRGQAQEELLDFFAPESFRIIFRISVYSHNTISPPPVLLLYFKSFGNVLQYPPAISISSMFFRIFEGLLEVDFRIRPNPPDVVTIATVTGVPALPGVIMDAFISSCFFLSFFTPLIFSFCVELYFICLKTEWCKSIANRTNKPQFLLIITQSSCFSPFELSCDQSRLIGIVAVEIGDVLRSISSVSCVTITIFLMFKITNFMVYNFQQG